MSKPKETFYFNPEMPTRRKYRSESEFQSAFSNIKPGQLAEMAQSGQCTVSFSANALSVNPEIKVVVCCVILPTWSGLYYYHIEKGYEDAPDLQPHGNPG